MSKQLAQEELEKALVTTFLANLSFLNEYDNKLFKRVDSLSQVINEGIFKENYSLEFLEDQGDFDIYDIKNKKFLYDKKALKFNNKALHSTDFTSKGSVSTLDSELFSGSRFDIIPEAEYMCNFEYSNKRLANETLKYFDILRDNLGSYKFKKYKYINKFMFIGTLLGRHIPLILDKLKCENYFVCEENLEIFRLSLFVVDYSNLARDGKTVVFSIMDDSHDFFTKMDIFLSNKSYENYCIKYYSSNFNMQKSFDNMMSSVLAHKSTTFNHHMMLENMWKSMTERISNYRVLQLLQKSDNKLLEKPLLFLGAGPSLGDNINWLKENQNKFIIVAMAATYKILFKNGIKPDIITTLDPQYSVLNKKHFDKKSISKLKDSFVLAAINTDQRILDRFNQDKLFLYEMVKPLHSGNICYKGFSVGEISASALLSLGFKNMYILGLDLAINQKTGASHTSGYRGEEYDSDFKDKIHKEESKSYTLKEELIKVKGNMQEEVFTNRIFALSLDAMSSNFTYIKRTNQKIYNLSNHGAYIENTISKKSSELNIIENVDKSSLDEELKVYLNSVSKDKLNDSDCNDLKKELEYLLLIKDEFINLKNKKTKNFNHFKEKIDEIINLTIYPKVNCAFLHVVFIRYYNIFIQYIYYAFNDQKLKHEKDKLEEVEELFLSKTITLLESYIQYVKKI